MVEHLIHRNNPNRNKSLVFVTVDSNMLWFTNYKGRKSVPPNLACFFTQNVSFKKRKGERGCFHDTQDNFRTSPFVTLCFWLISTVGTMASAAVAAKWYVHPLAPYHVRDDQQRCMMYEALESGTDMVSTIAKKYQLLFLAG